MTDEILIQPFTASQVRAFHSVWSKASLDSLGARKQELMDDLDKSIRGYLNQKLTPELTEKVRNTITRTAQAFAKRHSDIRITKSEIEIRLGNFDLNVQIERSGVALPTLRQFHPLMKRELMADEDRMDQTIRGRKAESTIFDAETDAQLRERIKQG